MNIDKIKNLALAKFFYKIPGLVWFYHFLLAFFAAVFYSFPSRRIFVIGVTGTKGKTTILELLNAILERAGKKTALLSSLRVKIGEESEKNILGNTMPGRFYIQSFLARAVKAGCKYALVEATSQGVALSRHRFINWNSGILINVHPEHIESHGSFEKYRNAKLQFLKYVLKKGGKVFLNSEDENFEFFAKKLAGPKTFSFSKNSQELVGIFPKAFPTSAAAGNSRPDFVLSDFNKDNVAAAVAKALDLGISRNIIEEALRNFRSVPGRMEFVRHGFYTAVVDYAHTPDSLEAVYKALRAELGKYQFPNPKLICVLGSAGGGRDKWKRPEFGKIASEYCDEIILTDEDPYDEDPEEIIGEIETGVREGLRSSPRQSAVHKIVDRKKAISKAIELAREGDIVVCTGKGSEDFIHVAHGKKIPWSEKAVVEEAIKQKRAS